MPTPDHNVASSHSAWITIGTFDGVHRGHQAILGQLIQRAQTAGVPAMVITFHPHPAEVLRNLNEPYYLCSLEERKNLLEGTGIDQVLVLPFTLEFSRQSARQFILALRDQVHFSGILVGHDFHFGAGREGDMSTLQALGAELGFSVETFPAQTIDGEVISSSAIRQLLRLGQVQQAAQLLGRWYAINGEVVHGDGRGRHIGIPTANLAVWSKQLLPAIGVYAARVELEGVEYPAVLSIGKRPTFYSSLAEQTLEVHILDFHQDLYGKMMQVKFIDYLRDELRFGSAGELTEQIQKDILLTREVLAHAPQTPNLPA